MLDIFIYRRMTYFFFMMLNFDSSFKILALDTLIYPLLTLGQESVFWANNFSILLNISQLSLFLHQNPPQGSRMQDGRNASLKVSKWTFSPAGLQLFWNGRWGNEKEKTANICSAQDVHPLPQPFRHGTPIYPQCGYVANKHWKILLSSLLSAFMLNTVYHHSYNFCN